MTQRLQRFAQDHYGVFRRSDAHERGVTSQMLWRAQCSGRIVAMFEDVFRFAGAPDSWQARALAAVWAGGELCGLSHRTAAFLWGLPGGSSAVTEVVCIRHNRLERDRLVVHEFSGLIASDLTMLGDFRVVVPELAVLHLAGRAWSKVEDVERLIYAARRRRLLTNGSLQEYLYRRTRRGRPGVRKLRAALELARPHARATESEMETMLLQTLRAHGITGLELQFKLRDASGKVIARVDAGLPEWMLLLEYESDEEHVDPVDLGQDNRRRLWAAKYGYWTIPVRKADLRSGGGELVEGIRGAIARLSALAACPGLRSGDARAPVGGG